MEIIPDDVMDTTDALNELQDWVLNKYEFMPVTKIAFMLITVGCELATKVVKDREDLENLITRALNLGSSFAKNR